MTGVRDRDIVRLDLRRWARAADPEERDLLGDVCGPVLEVGCGPGRLIAALAELGIPALGIDIAAEATQLAAARGAPTLCHSVFSRLPGEGRWPTVLLVDGNIGIGGDPVVLLRRVQELLAPGGVVLVEATAPGASTARVHAVVKLDEEDIGFIPWAELDVDDLDDVAARAGFSVQRVRSIGTRWFGTLRSERTP